MGLINKISNRILGKDKNTQADKIIKQATLRRCTFETMEERKVLSADSVVAGVTYLEGDDGGDNEPDHFEVTFEGGSETTELSQFVISGDQDLSGTLSDGDVFFDANSAPPGTSDFHGFSFDAANSSGVNESDIQSATVSADGLTLTVEVDNFEAGDVLAFTIDVDEVEGRRNDRIASGVEFESSQFTATFEDEHFTFEGLDVTAETILVDGEPQIQNEGLFFDEYDDLLTEGERISDGQLDLTRDDELGFEDRSAGAIDAYELVEKPIAISGTVYHDEDLDCIHDGTEEGISNVNIDLQLLNVETGQFETVASTVTDANGDYEFGLDLGLRPGTYQLVQTQPDGFLDTGAVAGSEGGIVRDDGTGEDNIIGQIEIPLGNTVATDYDFKEVRPASLQGNVYHDEDNDGVFDPNEQGIANVLIQVTRVGAKTGVTEDVFANTDPIFVRTDANGHYSVDQLPPGIYEVIEINNYPAGSDPLVDFIDGKDTVGTVDGTVVGQRTNDQFSQIELCADDHGVEYNFGEIKPASVSGFVSVNSATGPKLDPTDPNFEPIEGVTIQLFDADGNLVEETQTDATGRYEFDDLVPGAYSIVEVQPEGFFDGADAVGTVDGSTVGSSTNDRFNNVILGSGDAGVNYNFCEHEPASVSGYVSINDPGAPKLAPTDPNFRPIEGVTIQLFDAEGNLVEETQTDATGRYEFDNLVPGTYSIAEVQPEGFRDGADVVGTVDGSTVGSSTNDRFNNVVLDSGDAGVNYNFCEHEPASIKGTVYHDRNDNGIQDSGEEGIEGVLIQLFDDNGDLVAETRTDANGDYCFENLAPGEYKLREFQPDGFDDGQDTVGNVDGVTNGEHGNDEFCVITLNAGDEGVEYNFGEIRLAEIAGFVHVDNDGDCVFTPGETDRPIEGVLLELLDADGNVLATTTTAADGSYSFTGLLPGNYSIRQTQPDDFFTGGENVGDGGGDASTNLIENISISSGQKLTQYNFCEHEAAEIHGVVFEDGPAFETEDGTLPSNFRDQRDSILQANVDTPLEGVRLELYFFIDPTSGPEGAIAPRPVTISEVLASEYPHIDASNPDAPVFAETNAAGEYWFTGLQAGNYIVLEVQPEGLFDANDVVGTTTGATFNTTNDIETAFSALTTTFSDVQLQDVVAGIQVENGGVSLQNNFTEVSVEILPPAPPQPPNTPITPQTPFTPRPPGNPITPSPGVTGLGGLFGSEPSAFTQFIGTSRGASFQTQAAQVADPYTWHLSVINGGLPRAYGGDGAEDSIWHQAGHIDSTDWNRYDMTEAVWTFTSMDENNSISIKSEQSTFGMLGGTPLAGDFDGDGIDEMAVFKDGYWLIDINHNGRWDQEDLFAKLGDVDDRPVVGDWDGDGKDDIGIFGPMWERDEIAIDREPGLPNPDNDLVTRPKNVPPADDDATNGARIMKLSSYGQDRADVVDHVFGIEEGTIVPVTGDWNGNGIRSIGKFVDGHWEVDVNGDGRFDFEDKTFDFGRAGDIPLVGDFNGDGIEEIAVYRSGKWLIDTDGNRELTATDKTFELGGQLDKPVVGDFNGDGIDEPGLYTEKPSGDIQL